MFRETLLESANSNRKRNRWPMVMAFIAEVIVGALLVMLPLLSTSVISVSATRISCPRFAPDVHRSVMRTSAGGRSLPTHALIIPIANSCLHGCLVDRELRPASGEPGDADIPNIGVVDGVPNLPFGDNIARPHLEPTKPKPPVLISHLSEGQLIIRVDPVYPRMAIIAHVQGEVRLHAIIARDGSVQSLNVVGGPPLLTPAALEAVRQWRYKPYLLNGEAVEVETFITVNFKKTND